MSRSGLFVSVLTSSLASSLVACAVPPPPVAPYALAPTPVQSRGANVGERLQNDWQRIQDGLRLNQFTQQEFNSLRGRYLAIERTRQDQLAEFGGRIPPNLYAQLEQREDALSRSIFTDRHNGETPTAH